MTTTDIFLVGLLIVGIMIFHQLRGLSERLKSHLDQAEVDDVLSHTCPKFFFDPGRRSELRSWYCDSQRRAREQRDGIWHEYYERRYNQHVSEMPPNDVPLELAASQGNKWAQIQLLADASATFETERRKQLGLSRMEAQYLLNTFWRENSDLQLRCEEWNAESILAYVLRTKWFRGIDAND